MIAQEKNQKFRPTMESIQTHQVPQWYDDCKIGVFIHWGAYSVPAYAPPTVELGEIPLDEGWFAYNPYSEWYLNSLRIGKGATFEYHNKTYGADFPYEKFTHMWKAENWQPDDWAKLFKEAGAGYVVPVTKHHDGFCLWPSRFTEYHTANRGPGRDIIGELGEAVRQSGLKYGLYYSGILDWTYTNDAIHDMEDIFSPSNITSAYADYAFNQTMELIDRYQPSVLWNDIGWPKKGLSDLPTLFAHYYNAVPEGVVNDRWSNVWHDYTTKEYQHGVMTLDKKWEMCRGLGLSFAYNQEETEKHYINPNKLISLLLESVSHNGNLLINVGPKADGTIPAPQVDRLRCLGAWLKENGEAIYGTKPYSRQQEQLASDVTIYFTRKDHHVYLILDGCTAGDQDILIPGLGEAAETAQAISAVKSRFTRQGSDLLVRLESIKENSAAITLRIDEKG